MATFDQYGGLTSIPCANNTGFWHAEKLANSRGGSSAWWFCTPAGNAFFTQGPYVLDPTGSANEFDPFNVIYSTYVTTKYGDASNPNWAAVTLKRMQSWGWNTIAAYSAAYVKPWNTNASYTADACGNKTLPQKLPIVEIVRPFTYGKTNFSGWANKRQALGSPLTSLTAIKDTGPVFSPLYTATPSSNGVPDYSDPNISTWLTSDLANDTNITPYSGASASCNIPWLFGIAVEDSDQTYGLREDSNNNFASTPSGKNENHLGWIIATMSPVQAANSALGFLYSNPNVQMKQDWQTAMTNKYGTIGALNTAWGNGAAYTTFGSSGTQVNGEAFGTGDGATTTFTHTLASTKLDQHSAQFFLDGVLIGGFSNGSSFSNTTKACIYGARLTACNSNTNPTTGSFCTNVNSASGAVCTLVFDTSTAQGLKSSGSSQVVGNGTTATMQLDNVNWATVEIGDTITLASCGSFNGAQVVTGVGSGTSNLTDRNYQIQFSSATVATQNNCTFTYTAPKNGAAITVNYHVNGWCNGGTGLLDECGNGSGGTNFGGPTPGVNDTQFLTSASANAVTDLDGIIQTVSDTYFKAGHDTVKAAFPNTMYLGPDSLGQWTLFPRAPVIKSICKYADAVSVTGPSMVSQAQLDKWFTNCGDVMPIVFGEFSVCNADSVFSAPILSATRSANVVTVTTNGAHYNLGVRTVTGATRTPDPTRLNGLAIGIVGCTGDSGSFNGNGFVVNTGTETATTMAFNQTGNNATCNGGRVFLDDSGVISPSIATQAAHGATYLTNTQNAFNMAYTSNGVKPFAGVWHWRYNDDHSQRINWGVVTDRDNAYDGIEATQANVSSLYQCPTSTNLCQYNCGNQTQATTAYGDFFHNGFLAACSYWVDQSKKPKLSSAGTLSTSGTISTT